MISLQGRIPAKFQSGTQNRMARIGFWCPVCLRFETRIEEKHQHIKW